MSGTTCSKSGASKVLKQVNVKLKVLPKIFPGTVAWTILSSSGQVITGEEFEEGGGGDGKRKTTDQQKQGSTRSAVSHITQAARSFAATLVEGEELDVIHVLGNSLMFSAARIEGCGILAFVSAAPDTADADLSQPDAQLKLLCAAVQSLIGSTIPAEPSASSASSSGSSGAASMPVASGSRRSGLLTSDQIPTGPLTPNPPRHKH